jgi:hypothetical protein
MRPKMLIWLYSGTTRLLQTETRMLKVESIVSLTDTSCPKRITKT